jgi:hypothetical protein
MNILSCSFATGVARVLSAQFSKEIASIQILPQNKEDLILNPREQSKPLRRL